MRSAADSIWSTSEVCSKRGPTGHSTLTGVTYRRNFRPILERDVAPKHPLSLRSEPVDLNPERHRTRFGFVLGKVERLCRVCDTQPTGPRIFPSHQARVPARRSSALHVSTIVSVVADKPQLLSPARRAGADRHVRRPGRREVSLPDRGDPAAAERVGASAGRCWRPPLRRSCSPIGRRRPVTEARRRVVRRGACTLS